MNFVLRQGQLHEQIDYINLTNALFTLHNIEKNADCFLVSMLPFKKIAVVTFKISLFSPNGLAKQGYYYITYTIKR